MHDRISDAEAFKILFTEARTFRQWFDKPIEDSVLEEAYRLMRMAPTSSNTCPGRFLFVKTKEAKEKLLTAMDEGNLPQTRTAPVTVVVAHDMRFYEKMPKLHHNPEARTWFEGNDELVRTTAFRNGSLQGAYFILAARSVGLDCGPMSGFDNAKVDELFFKGTSWKSNFLINLGYGDPAKLHPRAGRLEFGEACKIV